MTGLTGSTENALKGKCPKGKWPSYKGKWPRWKIWQNSKKENALKHFRVIFLKENALIENGQSILACILNFWEV